MYLTLPFLASALLSSAVSARHISSEGCASSTTTGPAPSASSASSILSTGTRGIPANVEAFREAARGDCSNKLGEAGDFVYCGDNSENPTIIFLKGPGDQFDNMDIDCDGLNPGSGDCSNDQTGQSETAFKDQVKEASNNLVTDLDASKVPYVVFGNDGSDPPFDPAKLNMEPLSVMAVLCGDKLVYGIWGDVNADTSTGEASISLAKLCFPDEDITGDSGHDANDVLYIGFTGKDAVAAESYDWSVLPLPSG
ncbi:hypothetical protein FGG08_004088 [Glutinoglossum americanum]|uniref:Endo-chitosanase n=1 Tax=Glutinoglossum americanum TaxID=1670608 RepID=A0A9P8L2W0_9PEZI|nr:hypothetical protein FGG08_004088 [Glutinoglossum americanum]